MLAMTAGALSLAYCGLSDEAERLAAANRTLNAERNALKREAQAQRERVLALEAEVAAEKNRRIASAGVTEKALGKAQSDLGELRRGEEEGRKAFEEAQAEIARRT